MSIDDGGPAFPRARAKCSPYTEDGDTDVNYSEEQEGMSLRAWFAGRALSALDLVESNDVNVFARAAVRIADALIAELKK